MLGRDPSAEGAWVQAGMVVLIDPLVQGAVFLAVAGLWSVFVAKVLGPWAWARAVDNPKSKASVVLTRVLRETREAIAGDVKAALPPLPDFAAMQEDFQALKAQLTNENLYAVMSAVYTNHGKTAVARAGIGDDTITDADLAVIGVAGNIAEHPEQAQMAAGLIEMIQIGIDTGMIKEKGGQKTIDKIQNALAKGRDLSAIRDRLSKQFPTLAAGGSSSAPARGGGFNPG